MRITLNSSPLQPSHLDAGDSISMTLKNVRDWHLGECQRFQRKVNGHYGCVPSIHKWRAKVASHKAMADACQSYMDMHEYCMSPSAPRNGW